MSWHSEGRMVGLARGPVEAKPERGPGRGPHLGASTFCCVRFCLMLQVGKASCLPKYHHHQVAAEAPFFAHDTSSSL